MSFFENSKRSMSKKHTQLDAFTDNYNIIGQHHSKYIKQGYALKNWEGLSDEEPRSPPKKFDLNRSTLHLSLKKRKFRFINKC